MSSGPSSGSSQDSGAGRAQHAPPGAGPAPAVHPTPAAHAGGTHVLLVRHGEVDARHKGTFYGGAEVPLSEQGRAQSLLLAATLAQQPPQRIYTSPLSRAAFLAQALAERTGVDVVVEPDFRELDRGQWTHLPRAAIEARWPGALERYLADPELGAAPGGERESDIVARVGAALLRLAAAEPDRRVVVVTHAHVVRVAMRLALGWDAPRSLTRFVPYHGVVELRLLRNGRSELLAAPPGISQDALLRP